ncbi:MAG: CPBP family intramembrane glutamic endopeptidase [Planctomycetota bacterium]
MILAVMCLLPAFQTFVAVYLEWWPVVSYPALKGLMIVGPVAAWLWCRRGRREVPERVGWRKPNWLLGVGVGAALSGIILGGYYAIFRPMVEADHLVEKVESLFGIKYYWAMAVVISLWNALFEEYYWRGFLVSELGERLGRRWATVLAAGGLFGLHHIFALTWLGDPPLVALAVLATMVAGATWAYLRASGRSIIDCYVSHLLADLAIMWVGWDILQRAG